MNYAVSEFKPILTPPRRLSELEEARDVLLRIFLKDGFCIAVFRFGAIALPEDMEPRLRDMIGREVACLRLDGKFYLREADHA